MKWSGWPLTAIIAAISLVISYTLFQLGIYFFFLPLIFFIPLVGFFIKRKRSYMCPTCGLASSGNYCPRCGARLQPVIISHRYNFNCLVKIDGMIDCLHEKTEDYDNDMYEEERQYRGMLRLTIGTDDPNLIQA